MKTESDMKSLEGMSLDEAGARIVFAEKQALGLRKKIHQLDGHNQHFERCESRWCHPVVGDNLALEFAKDTAILNANTDRANARALRMERVLRSLRQYEAVEGRPDGDEVRIGLAHGSVWGPSADPKYEMYELAEAVAKWLHEKCDEALA